MRAALHGGMQIRPDFRASLQRNDPRMDANGRLFDRLGQAKKPQLIRVHSRSFAVVAPSIVLAINFGSTVESPGAVASVAQLVEQLTLNQLVVGSNPPRGTIFSQGTGFAAHRVRNPGSFWLDPGFADGLSLCRAWRRTRVL